MKCRQSRICDFYNLKESTRDTRGDFHQPINVVVLQLDAVHDPKRHKLYDLV